MSESASNPPPPSRLSIALGRMTLSAGRYPGRTVIGFMQRKQSRLRGGRRFRVYRPNDVIIDAWFSPRDAGTERLGRLPVLIAHGLFETKERHFKQAYKLNAHGHDVLLFDQRVHGRSTGGRLTFGIEEKLDMKALLDNAVERGLLATDSKVITLGFSLGGGTVLQHAAIDGRVAGVIALAPFGDFRSAIESFRKKLVPWLDERWVNDGFDVASAEAGFRIEEASALAAIAHIDAPLLLVEGGKDPFLPGADHVRKLAAMKPDGRITVLSIPGASHNSLVHRNWPELDEAVVRFCDDCCGQG